MPLASAYVPTGSGCVSGDDQEDLTDIGRRLRERMEGEFRAAAEEDEYWAMKQAQRSRKLPEVAYDMMSRGDHVEVRAAARVFKGTIVHTRGDLLTLQARGGPDVDVNLGGPIVLRITEAAATPGVGVARQGPGSFRARLSELEQGHAICEFITSHTEIMGRLLVRAEDHVVVGDADGQEWVVPLTWLAAVVVR